MMRLAQPSLPQRNGARTAVGGFTLIEILVVVAMLAIIMTIGIPFIRTAIDNGKGMTKAVKDIQEACSHARAIAILQQTTTELRIRPGDGVFEVGTSSSGTSSMRDTTFSPDVSGNEWRMEKRSTSSSQGGGGFSAKLPVGIHIEGLGLANDEDWTEEELARVRFYANGTSDEMSVVLLSDENERRNIWLEIVTGLPQIESDPQRFRAR
jgi:prepilin-type N-terminal cleavage/methylation domain-containing protein